MKKIELVYKEILYEVMENKNRMLTQSKLASTLKISLSTVNYALKPLREMGAIIVRQRRFDVIDPKKVLYHWVSIRNLGKDIIYKTNIKDSVLNIEKNMPSDIEYGAYSAYKFKLKDIPSDYSEVYVYSDLETLKEIKNRFKESKNTPNLFVLKKDFKKMTLALIFVDLWNLKEWYAKEFLKSMEKKIEDLLE